MHNYRKPPIGWFLFISIYIQEIEFTINHVTFISFLSCLLQFLNEWNCRKLIQENITFTRTVLFSTLVDSNSLIRKNKALKGIFIYITYELVIYLTRVRDSLNSKMKISIYNGKEWHDKKVYVPINALFKYLKEKTLQ